MENLGSRLKEERERLGLSQAKFSELCGVGKTAQFNYESNARIPSGDYLYEAGKLGVDVGYLLFGERSTSNSLYSLAAGHVLPLVAQKAGLNVDALMWILDVAAETESRKWGGAGLDLTEDDITYLVDELFNSGELLNSVILEVRKCQDKLLIPLPVDKKYSLIMMLFRSFKSTSRVDLEMIERAVKLAAS